MASRRATISQSNLKSDAKSSKRETPLLKPTTVEMGRKVLNSNSLTNESTCVPAKPSSPKPSGAKPRVGTSPRRSMAPQALATTMSRQSEPSLLGKSVLQSTFADGHFFPPDFDMSVIKEKTVIESAGEPERNPENEKGLVELQTFLLAYLTAKMESNTAKLKAEAEARILLEMEEVDAMQKEVHEKKRQYLLREKERVANELLDLQIAALTPVAEVAKQFRKDYNTFAKAVDTTRHELPVKNFYIDGDRKEFLENAEACLKETEKMLLECTDGDHKGNSTSLECLREMKMTSKGISQQLTGAFSELLELSSLVTRQTIHVQQATEEEQLGDSRTKELYCPKK